jgi:hypothetical protein
MQPIAPTPELGAGVDMDAPDARGAQVGHDLTDLRPLANV